MNHEEAANILGDLSVLVVDALRAKYGDDFLKDLCVRLPLYPAAGVSLLLSHVELPKCDELLSMIEGALRSSHASINVGPFTINCDAEADVFAHRVMERVKDICAKKGPKEALDFLSREALKIPYLEDHENGILLNVLAFIPQLLVYSQQQNIDVSQNIVQTHSQVSQFLSRMFLELGEELKRCKGR